MSPSISSALVMSNNTIRPSTPLRRRSLAPLQCNLINNIHLEPMLHDLIDRLKNSADSSTQLLIRLYQHKSIRLNDQPEKLSLFQQEIYSSLRRLHPSTKPSLLNQENQFIPTPQPMISCRSAQATIRKLH